jgi:hypothetical protein
MYLTDGDMLIYVVDLPKPGTAVVENAMTGRTDYVAVDYLEGWRVVEPDRGA